MSQLFLLNHLSIQSPIVQLAHKLLTLVVDRFISHVGGLTQTTIQNLSYQSYIKDICCSLLKE